MPFTPINVVNGSTPANATWGNLVQTQYTEATLSYGPDTFAAGFVLSGLAASKDGVTATLLDVTAGTAYLLQSDGTTRQRKATASTQTTSVINTTYYLYLQPDGTWYWSTTNAPAANSLFIAQVTTDGSGNIATVTDKRTRTTGILGAGVLAPNVASQQLSATTSPGLASNLVTAGVTFGAAALISGDAAAAAATFNGTTGYVALPSSGLPSGNGAWTLECWFKISANPAGNAVMLNIGPNSANANATLYLDNTGKAHVGVNQIFTFLSSAGAVSLNTPHHLVGIWNGTTLSGYLDNVSLGTATPAALALTQSNGYIGAYGGGTTNFPGIIAEAAVYTTALSSARVTAHYNAATAGGYAAAVQADAPYVYMRLNDPVGALYANCSVPSTIQTVGADGSATLGRVATLGGQASVGALGAPIIVAQAIQVHVAATTLQTIINYTVPVTGLYRCSFYLSFGNGTSEHPVAQVKSTDPNLGTPTVSFVAGNTGTFLDGSATFLASNTSVATSPITVYAAAGSAIQILYTDGAGTPNDYINALIERLS